VRVAVTGTPGTGKTTATDRVETALDVVHLSDVIDREGLVTGTDEERDTQVVDVDALREWFEGQTDVLVESHLAHELPVDRVVVLRCHPEELARRLRERDEPAATVTENAESEALDVILSAAVDRHGLEHVYEVDATDRTPDEVAAEIERVVAGGREPSAGDVSYIDYL
jgi:adenylate kinase